MYASFPADRWIALLCNWKFGGSCCICWNIAHLGRPWGFHYEPFEPTFLLLRIMDVKWQHSPLWCSTLAQKPSKLWHEPKTSLIPVDSCFQDQCVLFAWYCCYCQQYWWQVDAVWLTVQGQVSTWCPPINNCFRKYTFEVSVCSRRVDFLLSNNFPAYVFSASSVSLWY